ncbi:4-diphosphocytidyl-2-C-methyl-D-erythritol kinase [Rubricella aquisinus]|uniref:4-diphosphocytidyl-2-C-methyl-D-erythritol kinase n=1 Tax=Rubricella aquisinus TaxID=2028108 RepID=A0A840X0V7_9RHOB|nr:4-(cytidine 5'-diphospho)-2-C-methyl-D-erythritol kinase [Rubricella aquisinus]MBB5515525.1 4-diphosphocytidyl-2-C-methyl-D-erythritol kinase [Rubricella aquisinus]
MQTSLAPDQELAPAKVNLTLHVTGQRPDGYHLLDSLVVFPRVGDLVTVEPARSLSLTLRGPFGIDLAADEDNLVLRAARLILGPEHGAALLLDKALPVASGIGGGSSDAAATLRLLARQYGRAMPADVLSLGADVPVCLSPRPQWMRGIGGDVHAAQGLPPFWLVLVNAGVKVPTGPVFQGLASKHNPRCTPMPDAPDLRSFAAWLRDNRNDLEPPARAICPVIGDVITALEQAAGCHLARMSGSGATVFGLFGDERAALRAADTLRAAQPRWWVAAGPVMP